MACDAMWTEHCKWLAGFLPTGTCCGCFAAGGDLPHKILGCEAVLQELLWHEIAGRPIARVAIANDPALAPLALMGLPPKLESRQPVDTDVSEGALDIGIDGLVYGDASGCGEVDGAPAVVTWAIVRVDVDVGGGGGDRASIRQAASGRCGGWFPSVPRGELQAVCEFLKVARVPATYVGDCKYVVDILRQGVPEVQASSASPHADLWREALWRLRDHGPGIDVIKTKAHRSRTQAAASLDDPLAHWLGNDAADSVAKALARRVCDGGRQMRSSRENMKQLHAQILARTAASASVSIRLCDTAAPTRRHTARRQGAAAAAAEGCGDHVLTKCPSGGGQWCSRCRLVARTASSRRTLANKPCRGDVAKQIDVSHVLRWSAGVTWCAKCGGFATRLPRALRKPCPGGPSLKAGLPPTSAPHLARVKEDFDRVLDEHAAAPCGAGVVVVEEPPVHGANARSGNGEAQAALVRVGVPDHPSSSPTSSTLPPAPASPSSFSSPPVPSQALAVTSDGFRRRSCSSPPAAAASSNGSGGGLGAAAAVRRHITGKEPDCARRVCKPAADAEHWAGRVQCVALWGWVRCSACGVASKARCRGCSRGLCVGCARARRHCGAAGLG